MRPTSGIFRIRIDDVTNDVDLLAFTRATDRAASHVAARPIRKDIRINTVKRDIESWLTQCSNHDCCIRYADVSLPTRVIELNPSDDPDHVRLLNSTGHQGKYATLSYCWGAPSTHILTTATLDQYLDRIPWKSIPQSIKDAVIVARAASMQYLWVDAFCILQDDQRDKIHEIANM